MFLTKLLLVIHIVVFVVLAIGRPADLDIPWYLVILFGFNVSLFLVLMTAFKNRRGET